MTSRRSREPSTSSTSITGPYRDSTFHITRWYTSSVFSDAFSRKDGSETLRMSVLLWGRGQYTSQVYQRQDETYPSSRVDAGGLAGKWHLETK